MAWPSRCSASNLCGRMPNRSRDKQLAKLAARRQAERHAAKRRRDITLGVVGGVIGLALLVVGYLVLTGDDDGTAQASDTPTAYGVGLGGALGRAGHPVGVGGAGRGPAGERRVRRRGAGRRRREDPAVRGAAADDDRPEGDVHGHVRHVVRHVRGAAASRYRAGGGEQLRVPRRAGLLRRAHVPSHRRPVRDPRGRPARRRHGRPGLLVRHRDLAGADLRRCRAARVREQRSGIQRQPVLRDAQADARTRSRGRGR